MRPHCVLALIGLLAVACSAGGSAPPGSAGSSSGRTGDEVPVTGADATDPGDAHPECTSYIACVAKQTPALLGAATDAYGKPGSCWNEMSAADCENACARAAADAECATTCTPDSASCVGQACRAQTECATGEVCALSRKTNETTCAVDLVGKRCETTGCPAPYECTFVDAGDGQSAMNVCLLPCLLTKQCPEGQTCVLPTPNSLRVCQPNAAP